MSSLRNEIIPEETYQGGGRVALVPLHSVVVLGLRHPPSLTMSEQIAIQDGQQAELPREEDLGVEATKPKVADPMRIGRSGTYASTIPLKSQSIS